MPNRIFIDSDVRVFEGDEAATRLASRNDARFYQPGRGVARVDRDRWLEAQTYERNTWMKRGRDARDDRNREHMARFVGYRSLAGRHFNRAIELGCGPFTNLRFILGAATIDHVHLLDPLALDYVKHPHCRYRGGKLGGVRRAGLDSGWRNLRFAFSELAASIRAGGIRGRAVEIHATPIEDLETAVRFDLVVMINVIEHCRDIDAVFGKIDEILTPGGFFVFQDKFLSPGNVQEVLADVYDAGHPLRLQRSIVDEFLDARFDVEFRSEFRDANRFAGRSWETTAVYFVGRRRPVP